MLVRHLVLLQLQHRLHLHLHQEQDQDQDKEQAQPRSRSRVGTGTGTDAGVIARLGLAGPVDSAMLLVMRSGISVDGPLRVKNGFIGSGWWIIVAGGLGLV